MANSGQLRYLQNILAQLQAAYCVAKMGAGGLIGESCLKALKMNNISY